MAVLDTSTTEIILGDVIPTGSAIRGGSYSIVHVGPVNGNAIPMLSATLTVTVSHTIGWLADVEFQASRDQTFATVDWTTNQLEKPDGNVSALITGMVDDSRYYWRARVKESGAQGVWGAWTTPWEMIIDTGAGRAFGYVETNFGTSISQQSAEVSYVYSNIGWLPVPDSEAMGYLYENVSVIYFVEGDWSAYVESGDVSTNTPIPHIWFLKPRSGRPGAGIRIFGFGFGDLQTTFDAVIEIDYGVGDWQSVQPISWQTYPPDANAYTALRMLDPDTEYIDMQHTVVEVTVPDDAMPPGYPIRIRTNGP